MLPWDVDKQSHGNTHLCSRSEGVSEVDADHAAGLGVDHEVGEVAVTDAQKPVADTEQGVGAGEVGTQ